MANSFVMKRDADNQKTALKLLRPQSPLHSTKISSTLVNKGLKWKMGQSYLHAVH